MVLFYHSVLYFLCGSKVLSSSFTIVEEKISSLIHLNFVQQVIETEHFFSGTISSEIATHQFRHSIKIWSKNYSNCKPVTDAKGWIWRYMYINSFQWVFFLAERKWFVARKIKRTKSVVDRALAILPNSVLKFECAFGIVRVWSSRHHTGIRAPVSYILQVLAMRLRSLLPVFTMQPCTCIVHTFNFKLCISLLAGLFGKYASYLAQIFISF